MECASCGGNNPAGAKFCNACGSELSGGPSLREGEGERRQVTVLFADMGGYTPLAERLGEEETYRLMQPVYEHMIETIDGFGGTVQDLAGDGMVALFGAPIAVEDAPLRACRAALSLQSRMADLADELEARHGVRPQLRVGLNTGPVVIGTVGTDQRAEVKAVGDTVNLASRLQTEAALGSVLVSEATLRLVDGFVDSAFAGEREIKGKSEPQRVWLLQGVKAGVSRFDVSLGRGLADLVGREAELRALRSAWDTAQAGGVHIVDIVGDAGIGKSRLIYEFRRGMAEEQAVFLRGHCAVDGRNTAYLPFIDLIRDWFHIGDVDAGDLVVEKLRRGLALLDVDAAAIEPYLLNLLGQPVEGAEFTKEQAEIAGIRTREALQHMILARCATLPVVLFIDDLHWMDSASQALMRWAIGLTEPLPLLILCAYRPQYAAPWAEEAHVRTLPLSPLDSRDTEALLENRLAGHTLTTEMAKAVMARAEGNPLFAEEMVSYLVTKGEAGESGLPETLENLLMDRVDRLDPAPRLVLQTAAVVGRRFSRDLVANVLGPEIDLDTAIAALESERLIFHEPGDVAEYRFMHALVQDAIYETLLKQRREELHEKVAEAIETSHDEAETEAAELLAHHYGHTPRADKAAKYMALAAEKALRVYALGDAEYRIRQVMALIEAQPDCADDAFLADVLMVAGRVNYYRADFKSQVAMMTRHLPLIESLTDRNRRSRLLFEIGYALVFSGEHQRGSALLHEALAIAEAIDDPQAIAFCCMGLLYHHQFWNADAVPRREFEELSERGLKAARRARDVWSHSKILISLLQQTLIFGRPNEAAGYGEALFALSRETNDPRPRAMGLWGMAWLDAYHFKAESAVELADEALRLSLSRIDQIGAEVGRATALIELRRTEEAASVLERDLAEARRGDFVTILPVIQAMLGAAQVLNGRMSDGLALIERVIRDEAMFANQATRVAVEMILGEVYLEIAVGEERPPLSVLLRNLGFVVTTLPVARSRAERHLRSALAGAREMDATSLIARLQYDLGRLAKLRRKPEDARAAFAEARTLAESVEADGIIARIDAVA